MAASNLERRLYSEKIVVIPLGTLTDVDADNDVAVASMIVPRNLKLKGVGVSWVSSDNAAAGLTAKVTDTAATVLASSGAATPSVTESGVFAEDVDVFVSKDQVLCFTVRSVADTNDFVGAAITVLFEAPKTSD
jgi:hypothetical protein